MNRQMIISILISMLLFVLCGCIVPDTKNASADKIKNTKSNSTESAIMEASDAKIDNQEHTDIQSGDKKENRYDDIEITIFAAKSLNHALDDIIEKYLKNHKGVRFITNYDSSGTLMAQIEEGALCDIFFSAAAKQMDELESQQLLIDGTRNDIVKNQLCVVTYKGSDTKVTGICDLNLAENLAIADGTVPVGKYTRQALVNSGILSEIEDVSKITTTEISKALDGVEINECVNVGAVAMAISEGVNEVGTVYYSDTFSYDDKIEIIELVDEKLTGNVTYPAALVKNKEASDTQMQCAKDFLEYLTSDDAIEVFDEYKFLH